MARLASLRKEVSHEKFCLAAPPHGFTGARRCDSLLRLVRVCACRRRQFQYLAEAAGGQDGSEDDGNQWAHAGRQLLLAARQTESRGSRVSAGGERLHRRGDEADGWLAEKVVRRNAGADQGNRRGSAL